MVELIVVMAIIGLLFALIYPSITAIKTRAKTAECAGNLHQWGSFWNQYLADHDGRFSDGIRTEEIEEGDGTQKIGWHRGEWATVLRPYYLHRRSVMVCPTADRPNRNANGKIIFHGSTFTTYAHGKVKGVETAERSSYGINAWVYNPPSHIQHIQRRETNKNWRRPSTVKNPSRAPLMLDSMWRGGGPDQDMKRSIMPPEYNGQWLSTENEMMHFAMDRHLGGIQMVFFDMSARKVLVGDLWKLSWHKKFNPDMSYNWEFPDWIKKLTSTDSP